MNTHKFGTMCPATKIRYGAMQHTRDRPRERDAAGRSSYGPAATLEGIEIVLATESCDSPSEWSNVVAIIALF